MSEFFRVVNFLDRHGYALIDDEGDRAYAAGHTVRMLARIYADESPVPAPPATDQERTITTNYGLASGALDVTKFIEPLRTGPDGYINMDVYNRQAPWSGHD